MNVCAAHRKIQNMFATDYFVVLQFFWQTYVTLTLRKIEFESSILIFKDLKIDKINFIVI